MDHDALAWPSDLWLSKLHLTRLVASIIAAEIAAARGMDIQRLRPDLWGAGTAIVETDLALDSLERTNCAAALNQFFHLSDYGAEDYLLAAPTLGDWATIVAISIAVGSGQMTFETSGSTGAPKACTHTVQTLMEEAEIWAERYQDRKHIIALVPPHHIFGFIFTVLLPQIMGIPVVDVRYSGASGLKDALQAKRSLVIGAPVHWQYISRSFLSLPAGLRGVTSTAPMPKPVAARLKAQGLDDLTEIYGSTETAGVGLRGRGESAYTLLPHWSLERDGKGKGEDQQAHLVHKSTGAKQPLMDTVTLGANRTFTLNGRKDGAVQVGGTNVFPSRVADILRLQPQVAQCAVRLCHTTQRLMAFIVPHDPADSVEDLEQFLREACTEALTAAERPTRYDFGLELPQTPMGKSTAW